MSRFNKKILFLAVVLSIVLSNSSTARAQKGGMDSGGGNAVVCRGSNGKIRSAEFFDLFEGRSLYKMQVLPELARDPRSFEDLAVVLGNKAFGFSGADPRWNDILEIRKINKEKQKLPRDAGVNVVDDSLSPIVGKGCHVEQAAVYLFSGLYVDSEIWAALDKVSKAALLLHEAVYKMLRDSQKEENSIRTRRIVAAVFSGRNEEKSIDEEWASHHGLACVGKGEMENDPLSDQFRYLFYIYPVLANDGKWELRFRFFWFNGIHMFGETYLDTTNQRLETEAAEKMLSSVANLDFKAWNGNRLNNGPLHSLIDFDLKLFVGIQTTHADPEKNYMVAGIYKGGRPYPGGGGNTSGVVNLADYDPIECKAIPPN